MSAGKRVYDALPVFAQNWACSWAGRQRYRARFGEHFRRTLAHWQQTGNGPLEKLHEIQRQRLDALVRRAREHVPYYRDLPPPSEHVEPKRAIEETLSRIPVLEKSDYRAHTEELVARDIPKARLRHGVTSGTTGTALRLYYTPEALAEEYASVWRMRCASGVALREPHLTFGGQIVVPYTRSKPPFWRYNAYSRQLLFSLYHMTPENLSRYVRTIHESDAVYANGYPSALHLVARAMLERDAALPKGRLKAVFTSSESLLAFHRESIERAFGCPVVDRYGTSEFAVSMTGCSENRLHVDMEFGIVEVEAQEQTDEYVRGPLLVTGLSNDATPFLRYRIADVGTRLRAACPCGRPGDVFLDVDGRIEDFVETPDGRLVGRMDHVFKNMTNVEEAQFLQSTREAIEVLFVPAAEFDEAAEAALLREIRARLGDEIQIELRRVAAIPREKNGKFRAVKSHAGKLEA